VAKGDDFDFDTFDFVLLMNIYFIMYYFFKILIAESHIL
jgi:hypothetical protein